MRFVIDKLVYFVFAQRNIAQASYWQNPHGRESYRKYNSFLADINQEKVFNSAYRENMLKLENFVLVKFDQDEMVDPMESQVKYFDPIINWKS